MVDLKPVGADNWRAVANLEVAHHQRDFVMSPAYYLALCAYDPIGWRPLAITADGAVTGFLMWAVDPADGACWLGGVMIDHRYQGRGIGRRAVVRIMRELAEKYGFTQFALSYNPSNTVARNLYKSLGFVETGSWEGSEVVARCRVTSRTAPRIP